MHLCSLIFSIITCFLFHCTVLCCTSFLLVFLFLSLPLHYFICCLFLRSLSLNLLLTTWSGFMSTGFTIRRGGGGETLLKKSSCPCLLTLLHLRLLLLLLWPYNTLIHSLFTTKIEYNEGLLMLKRFQSMSKHFFLRKAQKSIMAKCE